MRIVDFNDFETVEQFMDSVEDNEIGIFYLEKSMNAVDQMTTKADMWASYDTLPALAREAFKGLQASGAKAIFFEKSEKTA